MKNSPSKMSLAELQRLLAEGESETLEFKRSTAELREALETACAFLNGQSGKVVIGVKPDGTLTGQQIADKTLREVADAMEGFEPHVRIEVERVRVSPGNEAMVFHVEGPRDEIPFAFRGQAYERVLSTTRRMSKKRYEELLLERAYSKRRWENQEAEEITIRDIDGEEAVRIAEIARSADRFSGPIDKNLATLLERMGVAKDGKPLRAAVVLFGKRFLPDYPQCELRMARFRGTDKTEFLDQRQLRGPAFKLLEEAEIFCSRHLPLAGRIEPGKMERVDRPLIPPGATREIFVNALIHRDYSIAGGAVSLAIFDDRVELWSAGTLPFGLTPAALTREHQSRPRNPLIADVFHRAGLFENWGRGTNRVIDICLKHGIPPPEFAEISGATVVIFRVPVGRTIQVSDHVTVQVSDHVTAQVKAVLKAARQPRSSKDLMETIGLKHRSYFQKKILEPLLTAGWLEMTYPDTPKSRLQRYRATAAGLVQVGG